MLASNWPLVPIAVFYLLCAIVGIIGNSVMIVVFLKESRLKLPVNYLITLNCLADLFHVSGHFVFNYQLFTETTSSQAACFFLSVPAVFGYFISGPLLLAIGIDRLVACQLPVTYRSILLSYRNLYLSAQLLFPFAFTTFFFVHGSQLIDYDTKIVCMIPLAMPHPAFTYYSYASNIINIAIVFVYMTTYFVLGGYKGRDACRMRNVFKSIAVTVLVVLVGYVTVAIGNTVAFGIIEHRKTSEIVSIHAGIGVNVSCSINVFVFYAINSEYRTAIRHLLDIEMGKTSDSTKVRVSESTTNKGKIIVVAPAGTVNPFQSRTYLR